MRSRSDPSATDRLPARKAISSLQLVTGVRTALDVEERYATELLAGETSAVGYLLKQRVADVRDFLDALERVASG